MACSDYPSVCTSVPRCSPNNRPGLSDHPVCSSLLNDSSLFLVPVQLNGSSLFLVPVQLNDSSLFLVPVQLNDSSLFLVPVQFAELIQSAKLIQPAEPIQSAELIQSAKLIQFQYSSSCKEASAGLIHFLFLLILPGTRATPYSCAYCYPIRGPLVGAIGEADLCNLGSQSSGT